MIPAQSVTERHLHGELQRLLFTAMAVTLARLEWFGAANATAEVSRDGLPDDLAEAAPFLPRV